MRRLVIWYRRNAAVTSLVDTATTSASAAGNVAGSVTSMAGTVVNSYLIHFDPNSDDTEVTFQITFEDAIVGVIAETGLLEASDSLSFADPEFEADAFRGLDSGDGWTITEDGHTIQFSISDSLAQMDQVRILTRSSLNVTDVPEPSSLSILTLGGLIMLRR